MNRPVPSFSNINLGVLYLAYPGEKHPSEKKPLTVLKSILSRFPCQKHIVYINNAAHAEFSRRISENEYEISGDNRSWEFSGWQKGIDFLKKNNLTCDAFLLVNDMFLHDSIWQRRLFVNQDALECALMYNVMVGQRMHLPVPGTILGNMIIPYIRTHCFILPRTLVDSLGTVVSLKEDLLQRLFVPRYAGSIPIFSADAPLAPPIREFIFSHVTSKWSRKKAYTVENFEILKNKSAAIINALLLSIRANQLGYSLLSFNDCRQCLSKRFSVEDIERRWFQGFSANAKTGMKDDNKFWLNNIPFYNNIAGRKITLTWTNILDLLLGRASQFDHL